MLPCPASNSSIFSKSFRSLLSFELQLFLSIWDPKIFWFNKFSLTELFLSEVFRSTSSICSVSLTTKFSLLSVGVEIDWCSIELLLRLESNDCAFHLHASKSQRILLFPEMYFSFSDCRETRSVSSCWTFFSWKWKLSFEQTCKCF